MLPNQEQNPRSKQDFQLLASKTLVLPRSPSGEAPCGAHVFEGFFGLENGPVKSYPQTHQDTVVGVFPMESSN